MKNCDDILESGISDKILKVLLFDQTTKKNIIWATSDYSKLGEGYQMDDHITVEAIKNDNIIIPRVLKSYKDQDSRVRNMAEVFTPSWVCNLQNNLIDDQWFGVKGVFNEECKKPDGTRFWKTNTNKITFPNGKSWTDYISECRMEITCGEAPYLVSRYDTTTGSFIPIPDRIGLLDRKLRVICENTNGFQQWLSAVTIAYKSVYGYEWQGDNLLLARESLFQSFCEYYEYKFPRKTPTEQQKLAIAEIISWNLWQMDGLKGVVPNSCHDEIETEVTLFGKDENIHTKNCLGCQTNNLKLHNGIKCQIMDWEKNQPFEFISLIK